MVKAKPRAGELTTPYLGLTKPTVGASDDQWGGYINGDLDIIDTTVNGVSNVANAAYPASNPSNYQTAAQVTASLGAKLSLSGGTLTGGLVGTSLGLSGDITCVNVTGSGQIGSTAGAVVSRYSGSGNGPTFTFQNTSGVAQGWVIWNTSNGQVVMNNVTGGGTAAITITPSFNINCGSFQPGGGAWGNSSDARIKDVEGDYTLGLDQVLALRPIVYRYKGNDTTGPPETRGAVPYAESPHAIVADARTAFVGLIAQEVETIFPGMVTTRVGYIDGEPVDDIRDLNTTELIFALVNAVKTLAAEVNALKATAAVRG